MAQLEFTELEQSMIGLQNEVVAQMRKKGLVPYDTGQLQRSIKPRKLVDTKAGIVAPISFLFYGAIQNSSGYPHEGWITEAEQNALKKQEQAVAQAAGQDVANYIDDLLPENINVTLDV